MRLISLLLLGCAIGAESSAQQALKMNQPCLYFVPVPLSSVPLSIFRSKFHACKLRKARALNAIQRGSVVQMQSRIISEDECSRDEDKIMIAQTRAWVKEMIVELNLCPFARTPFQKDTVRYSISNAQKVDTVGMPPLIVESRKKN
ncbi:hypothetical protein GUITHDRAFT_98679 [Guillardia theta CCMP2712]|uniref:Uncharacterized protein n=1 Tax=Guillardia theta (strain CCMP2712) TaxID=905079 RepID=L1I840_GUITC|nr:hypothetical protein GUITHDRAFT_98679 [Guillardia theta CCMP2712]EKX32025.1 hypothetical protein GUITHDRAFT_98679 [Guillardia theta CCMP2712]|eukprot:XP_005819005.1 hypothetical protein GUITHDRAFT_98679 [Guillardia theta CCMP2712]